MECVGSAALPLVLYLNDRYIEGGAGGAAPALTWEGTHTLPDRGANKDGLPTAKVFGARSPRSKLGSKTWTERSPIRPEGMQLLEAGVDGPVGGTPSFAKAQQHHIHVLAAGAERLDLFFPHSRGSRAARFGIAGAPRTDPEARKKPSLEERPSKA